jgi:DNA-binding CsgD family transcriptional regulator
MLEEMTDVERQVYDMLGEHKHTPEIAAALGMTSKEALPIVLRVIDKWGTPNLAFIRRQIDRIATVRVA